MKIIPCFIVTDANGEPRVESIILPDDVEARAIYCDGINYTVYERYPDGTQDELPPPAEPEAQP